MLEDLIKTFTDRHEAIALFELLRKREPHQSSWPLLPILTFIAPGGSGKSTLIEYLIAGRCCKDGRAILPYAYIDFTEAAMLRDLLPILIELRDQLHGHQDEQGKRLTFPRFDLGASIAIKAPLGSQLPSPDRDAVRQSLKQALPVFRSLNEMGNALGNIFPYIPPLLVGAKWAKQLAWKIQPLQELLVLLEYSSDWRWYCTQDANICLGTKVEIRDVLLRLLALSTSSRPGKEGRDYFVNHVLPAAFLADLLDSLDGSNRPHIWNSSTNIVLFLDGFEVLLESSNPIGIRLLESLACSKHRKHGETDALLFIVGSQRRLLELVGEERQLAQNPPLERQTYREDTMQVREGALGRYISWRKQLPKDLRYLRLSDLYLPLWLHDFGLEDTHQYLESIDRQEKTMAFADEVLVKAIHHATYGHPLYLALAAAAVLEANARGQVIMVDEFEQAPVPQLWDLAPGYEDERIGDYLLHLFLRQLPQKEQNDLIFCAAPRFLDPAILRAVLTLSTNLEAEERWSRYRRFAFMRVMDSSRMVFHPLVRKLLLKQLKPSQNLASDYYRTHSNLWDHFHITASNLVDASSPTQEVIQIQIEEIYHALALGVVESAIVIAAVALKENFATWEAVLEAVAQAPTALMPQDTELFADIACHRATQQYDPISAVASVVLYTWLLTACSDDAYKTACIQRNLGNAYCNLAGGDHRANLNAAIACYESSLSFFNYESLPVEWAGIKNNIGIAYQNLPGVDKQANLNTAIDCYNAALGVFTRESHPADWAMVQNNLGTSYQESPAGDRQANLEKAIACYEAILQVRTREELPVEWATTQNNLGNAYQELPAGDRQANLEKAITHYKAALQVRTREELPVEWATTQCNLGEAYRNLMGENQQANLENAILCNTRALEVFSHETFPYNWAITQYNLGLIYSDLVQEDYQSNLKKAIESYEMALQIFTSQKFPREWAMTQINLGEVYNRLVDNRQDNLKRAIKCYEAVLHFWTQEIISVTDERIEVQNKIRELYNNLQNM